MTDLLKCPKCEQCAVVHEEFQSSRAHDCPDCECYNTTSGLTCLACGHNQRSVPASVLADAQDREEAWEIENGVDPVCHWAAKIKREKEKVARLKEGRW